MLQTGRVVSSIVAALVSTSSSCCLIYRARTDPVGLNNIVVQEAELCSEWWLRSVCIRRPYFPFIGDIEPVSGDVTSTELWSFFRYLDYADTP